jgi:hypothetical protein
MAEELDEDGVLVGGTFGRPYSRLQEPMGRATPRRKGLDASSRPILVMTP